MSRRMAEITHIIEGRNPVLEALKAGRLVSKVLLVENVERHGVISQILYLCKNKDIPVEYVERHILDKRSSTGVHQGVIAYAAAKEYIDLDDLLAIPKAKNEVPLYIILDGVEDPQNMGAILRTADATGVHGVILRERRAVGLTPAVAKASAGAIEYMPVARVVNISRTIEILKKNNVWVVGLDQDGKLCYDEVDFKIPTAIVIGSEGKGLSELVKKKCDYLAYIPMKGKLTSLNASVAGAVVMYEALRQRRQRELRGLS